MSRKIQYAAVAGITVLLTVVTVIGVHFSKANAEIRNEEPTQPNIGEVYTETADEAVGDYKVKKVIYQPNISGNDLKTGDNVSDISSYPEVYTETADEAAGDYKVKKYSYIN